MRFKASRCPKNDGTFVVTLDREMAIEMGSMLYDRGFNEMYEDLDAIIYDYAADSKEEEIEAYIEDEHDLFHNLLSDGN